MKKAEKIAIGVVGGIATVGAGLLGKYLYESASELSSTAYGIPKDSVFYLAENLNGAIEPYVGIIEGRETKKLIRMINNYNHNNVFPNHTKIIMRQKLVAINILVPVF